MFNGISPPIFWLAVAVLMGIIEALTMGLTTIWFLAGALLAMIAAMFGLGTPYQIVIFIAASYALLYYTRPVVLKHFQPKLTRTNADRLVGQTGLVVQRLDPVQGRGQVKVAGQVWSAVSADGTIMTEGTRIEVTAITGVKLTVIRIEE